MNENVKSPVTENSEQATAYVADKRMENGFRPSATTDSNSCAQLVPAEGCIGGRVSNGANLPNPKLGWWDGKSLQSTTVYYRNRLMGLPVLYIKENRNDIDRASYWQEVGKNVGIAQPVKLASARVAEAAGFSLGYKDPKTGKWYDATDDQIADSYVLIDGYGRSAGHNLELGKAMSDPDYEPFDIPVLVDNGQDPDLLRAQFISINQDVKKTNKSDLLRYADKTKRDPNTIYYDGLLKENFVSKAAQNYAYGRELRAKDIKDISSGKTISVDTELTGAMQQSLEVYKTVLFGSSSAKILKGVPLAAWTRDKLRTAINKAVMLEKISVKFKSMTAMQLAQLQEARGVKGDKTQTTEIVLRRIFDEILEK